MIKSLPVEQQKDKNKMYNVAFEYTVKSGGYIGNRIWTNFESKEAFDAWYTDTIKEKQVVIEEGITQERCVELVRETPAACEISAMVQKSFDPETGRLDLELLRMNMLALRLSRGID